MGFEDLTGKAKDLGDKAKDAAKPARAEPERAPVIAPVVRAEPVNASLSTPDRHSAAPVSPRPCTTWSTGCAGHAAAQVSARNWPTAA